MKRVALIAAAAIGLGAAVSITYAMKYDDWIALPASRKLIANQMRDPESTQFRNDRFTKSGWLCGELNTKNGVGGYVGFARYISGGSAGKFFVEGQPHIGPRTTEVELADLGAQTEVLEQLNRLNEQGHDFPRPSQDELRETARSNQFERKWLEICE